MKTTKQQRDKINLLFSSFLVIGYIVCAYFFTSLAKSLSGTAGSLIQIAILLVFGLLLFYATRVGEGTQIKRFSLAVLLLIDLPALYIILAALIPTLPLSGVINPAAETLTLTTGAASEFTPSIILTLAAIALGYGLPYTFFAGYEINEEAVDPTEDEAKMLEGGLAEELAEAEAAEETVKKAEETAEEAAAEAEEPAEAAEEAAEPEEEKKETEEV